MSVLERKIINYIVVCINEFALSKNLTEQEAFRYLYANKGIEFLTENYDIEHTLSLQDAVNDLSIVCRNNARLIIVEPAFQKLQIPARKPDVCLRIVKLRLGIAFIQF